MEKQEEEDAEHTKKKRRWVKRDIKDKGPSDAALQKMEAETQNNTMSMIETLRRITATKILDSCGMVFVVPVSLFAMIACCGLLESLVVALYLVFVACCCCWNNVNDSVAVAALLLAVATSATVCAAAAGDWL